MNYQVSNEFPTLKNFIGDWPAENIITEYLSYLRDRKVQQDKKHKKTADDFYEQLQEQEQGRRNDSEVGGQQQDSRADSPLSSDDEGEASNRTLVLWRQAASSRGEGSSSGNLSAVPATITVSRPRARPVGAEAAGQQSTSNSNTTNTTNATTMTMNAAAHASTTTNAPSTSSESTNTIPAASGPRRTTRRRANQGYISLNMCVLR